jgi:protein-S-isoprenylcysteine O-methyltransferase Ste14
VTHDPAIVSPLWEATVRQAGSRYARTMLTVDLGIAALLAWLGFERIFRVPGIAARWRGDSRDRASTWLLIGAFGVAALVPVALSGLAIGSIGDAAWAGVALAGLGLVVRAWAMRTLGSAYTRTLRTDTGQTLVTVGPYRWVRHPGYAGSIGVWVGASLAFHNWLAALIVAGLMFLAYAWRIDAEERVLRDAFGGAYEAYAARTAHLIPGLY